MATWFEKLVGFSEESPVQVRDQIQMQGSRLKSLVNGEEFEAGRLSVVPLSMLRSMCAEKLDGPDSIKLENIRADVRDLHADPDWAGATFQVASQFNLLEMIDHRKTPEDGVGIYEHDGTQGPACAIACGAGTIYRNYFMPIKGKIGQSADNQVDCLSPLSFEFTQGKGAPWDMQNGYALLNSEGLDNINKHLESLDHPGRERLKGLLCFGCHQAVQVTIANSGHLVNQVYCSALPVGNSNVLVSEAEPFARLVLEAAYEATFLAAALSERCKSSQKLFLTYLGGGAFGNPIPWINESMDLAIERCRGLSLDVSVVSFG